MDKNPNPISENEGVDLLEEVPFEHTTVVQGNEAVECTIFPRDCTDSEILTNWITARGNSFVPLDSME